MFKIEHPIIQAPMANSALAALAIGAAQGGSLGSLGCASLSPERVREEVARFREATRQPLNLNFFCHRPPQHDRERERNWKRLLMPYYEELGLDANAPAPASARSPFDETAASLVEELRPEIVSFHFGLPEETLLNRVRASGARIVSSATTVEEARWLEGRGCDAIIAQGAEAGGHRGMFLAQEIATQVGTMALVPQIVDAVKVPVIAAGGIGDGRGIAAAFALGAAAVQIGTAYLFCPESTISPLHRAALLSAREDQTMLTNIFTGRPARGIVNRIVRELGPISGAVPDFPLASGMLAPLQKADPARPDFMPLWSGQAARLGRECPAAELTACLAEDALARLSRSFGHQQPDDSPRFGR
ncbi:MAG: 2-nitropropane dioxygenase [Chthoniobacteraceae bacterium]|nr:2-nitropropane dioxygenase [Chthoniobacteraceae bacterium]